eukprot:XP_017944938.1 PREDICTED: molybdenum cofactor sulfurase isoform X2 [Xenopus tropicalis]
MEHIQNHTHTLASYTYSVLSALRYANGASVIQIYSDTEFRMLDVQGPVINFNVLDESGGIIGYSQVDKLASLYNIHFRTGCFCNSGACQKHLRNSNMDVKQNLMVSQWPVTEQGLLFDRNWMIVNENRVCFSQKNEPKLCLIHPSIDLKKNIMIIKAKGMDPIETPLMDDSDAKAPVCQNKVCGDRVHTYDCGEKIADWLSRFLNRKCHLIRQSSNFSRFANANRKGLLGVPHSTLSLVNEAQYLLVNRASIVYLRQQLESSDIEIDQLTQRFRANIVINGSQPFEEENWAEVFIDGLHFQVSGKCNRCQIICIDQHTGEKKKDVFQTLSTCREGKATFGMYLLNSSCSLYPALLKVGSPVIFAASASRQSKNTAK